MDVTEESDKTFSMNGHSVANPASWRKAIFDRPFSPAERILCCDTGGSEWNWEYEKGKFVVEFRGDGFNHFIAKDYPTHSHWSLTGDLLTVNFGKYGIYEVKKDIISKLKNIFFKNSLHIFYHIH